MFWKKMTILLVLVLAFGLTTGVANADFTFGEPTNLGPTINSPADEWDMSLSADELILVFSSDRDGGSGKVDLWMSTRQMASDPWLESVNLGPAVNSSQVDDSPSLSADGLILYFSSGRAGGGNHDIFISTRESRDNPWSDAVKLGPAVNSSFAELVPFVSTDELELYFSSFNRPGSLGDGLFGQTDIWVSTRETKDDPWGEPVNLGSPVNTVYEEYYPTLSPDGLLLFFNSGLWGPFEDTRPGGLGESDIWVARRKSRDADWEEPVNLGSPINSSSVECAPTISPDGSTIYFSFYPLDPVPASVNYGWNDFWQAPIIPIVDLNSDGIVDAADMTILVDNWHTENTLCDIAPAPLGDGFVDVQDLIVLAEHLFEEVPPVE